MDNKKKLIILAAVVILAVFAVVFYLNTRYFDTIERVITPEEQGKVIQDSLKKIDDLQARVDAGETFTAEEILKQTDELNALQSQIMEIEQMLKETTAGAPTGTPKTAE